MLLALFHSCFSAPWWLFLVAPYYARGLKIFRSEKIQKINQLKEDHGRAKKEQSKVKQAKV